MAPKTSVKSTPFSGSLFKGCLKCDDEAAMNDKGGERGEETDRGSAERHPLRHLGDAGGEVRRVLPAPVVGVRRGRGRQSHAAGEDRWAEENGDREIVLPAFHFQEIVDAFNTVLESPVFDCGTTYTDMLGGKGRGLESWSVGV